MTYLVAERITLQSPRGDVELEAGEIVKLPVSIASDLQKKGLVRSLPEEFERLFREHALRMRELPAIDDTEETRAIVTAMDAAWYREDLPAFTIAIRRLEAIHMLAAEGTSHLETKGSPSECTRHTPPDGTCTKYTMKYSEGTRDLQPWCRKYQNWCIDSHIERERRERYSPKEPNTGRYS